MFFTPFIVYVVAFAVVEDVIPFIKGITVFTFAYTGFDSPEVVPSTAVGSIGKDTTVPFVVTSFISVALTEDVATIKGYGLAP